MSHESERSASERLAVAARASVAAGVGRARRLYERYAESGERSVNALGGPAARAGARLRNVAGAMHGYDWLERNAANQRRGLRDIAMRLLIATDTNVRAGFDCAERLIEARSAREVLAVQSAFLRDQARRSAEQAIDLQRVTAEAAARMAFCRSA